MLRVGLTGGICAGKSEVSRRLKARGAVVIDADVLAREVVAPGSQALTDVVAEFGEQVLQPDGRLDRAALAARVFADETGRHRLEQIIHPRVRARAAQIEAAAGVDAVVVHDIPLLVETGQQADFDVVVVVDLPPSAQAQRLIRSRGMNEAEAWSRIRAQAPRDERAAAGDVVIDNAGSLSELDAAVDELWTELSARSGAGSGG